MIARPITGADISPACAAERPAPAGGGRASARFRSPGCSIAVLPSSPQRFVAGEPSGPAAREPRRRALLGQLPGHLVRDDERAEPLARSRQARDRERGRAGDPLVLARAADEVVGLAVERRRGVVAVLVGLPAGAGQLLVAALD